MTPWAIVDTGPLVAFFDRRERHHAWAVERIRALAAPLLVCEPVLTEAMFLLGRLPAAQDALLRLLDRGALRIGLQLGEHVPELRTLFQKYQDRPISLADACIVRMAELYDKHAVFTLDADFTVYRKHGREPLDVIHPAAA